MRCADPTARRPESQPRRVLRRQAAERAEKYGAHSARYGAEKSSVLQAKQPFWAPRYGEAFILPYEIFAPAAPFCRSSTIRPCTPDTSAPGRFIRHALNSRSASTN